MEKSVLDLCDSLNINYVNATCPFVAKIHKIVNEYSSKGYTTIIAGDKNHQGIEPEVAKFVVEPVEKSFHEWKRSSSVMTD